MIVDKSEACAASLTSSGKETSETVLSATACGESTDAASLLNAQKTATEPDAKLLVLEEEIGKHDSMLVAFSGGVDSSLLLDVASSVLADRVLAVTARSCSFPERERAAAAAFCRDRFIAHLEIESEELDVEGFSANPINRCYLCKRELFAKMLAVAAQRGIAVVAEGSNTSDEGDYRPGLQAIAELGVLSPLRAAGLNKDDVRRLSRLRGLPTWDKPSFACLASRLPYGTEISAELLERIDAAEEFIIALGFAQVRVRVHSEVARIEVEPCNVNKLASEPMRTAISERLHALGFAHVALDLDGYRSGSMNLGIVRTSEFVS